MGRKKRSFWGLNLQTVLVLVVVLGVLGTVGTGIMSLHFIAPPSLTEGVSFHMEGVKIGHWYTSSETKIGRDWDYSYMNGFYFHSSENLPIMMSVRSMGPWGVSMDGDLSDDGLPDLHVDLSTIGVTDQVLGWQQTYDLNNQLVNSGAVLRRYRFYILFYTDSYKPWTGPGELDASWKNTKIWLHFYTQRWDDEIYQQFGAEDLVGNFTTFLDIRAVDQSISAYTGGGKTGEWTKTKHRWSPVKGQAFYIYSPDYSVEPSHFKNLVGEPIAYSGDRARITPVNEVMVPLVIEEIGGYFEEAAYIIGEERFGDPYIRLTCEAVVLTNYNYLVEEGPPQPPNGGQDPWAWLKNMWDHFVGVVGLPIAILIVIVVAILILRGLSK